MSTAEYQETPIGQKRIVSVALSQDDASSQAPDVAIFASFGGVWVEVGRQSFPAPSGLPGGGKRLVAVLDVPGVQAYRVEASGDAAPLFQADATESRAAQALTWITSSSPGPTPAQPDSYAWVAMNGNDTTGQIGRIDRPFATVQAALLAAEAGPETYYAILIAPGSYPGWAIPQSGKSYAFVAQGEGVYTGQIRATASPSGPGPSFYYFRNLSAFSEIGPAFAFDGSSAAGWLPEGLIFDRCSWSSLGGVAMRARLVSGPVVALNCRGSNCDIEIDTCGSAWVEGYRSEAAFGTNFLRLSYDPTNPPASGRGPYRVIDSSANAALLDGCPWVEYTNFHGSSFDLGTLISFTDGLTTIAPIVRGSIDGSELQHSLPNAIGPVPPVFDFWGCSVSGLVSASCATRQRMRVRNSVLSTLGAGEVFAQTEAILDLHGSVFNQIALDAIGNGSIDRDAHTISTTTDTAGGPNATIPIFPPFSNDHFTVQPETEPFGGAPVSVSFANKFPAAFDQVANVAGVPVVFTVQQLNEAL